MEQYCGVFICIAFFPGSSKFMETFDQETNFWTDVSKHPISILFRNYFFCRLAGSLVFVLFVATQVSIIHPFGHKLIIVAITTSNCRPLTGRWQVSEAFYFMRHCPGEHCCCAWCEPHVPRPWPGTPWGAVREGEAVTVQSPQVRIQIRWRLTAEVPGRGSREELGWCRGFMLIQQQSVLHFKGGDHGNQKKIHFALFFAKKMCKKCVFFEKFENCAKMWESSKKKFVFPLIGLKTSFRWGGCNFYQFDYLTKKFPIHCFSGTSCGSVIKEKIGEMIAPETKQPIPKKIQLKSVRMQPPNKQMVVGNAFNGHFWIPERRGCCRAGTGWTRKGPHQHTTSRTRTVWPRFGGRRRCRNQTACWRSHCREAERAEIENVCMWGGLGRMGKRV